MITGSKETQCSKCGHLAVCLFTRNLLEVQKTVDNISISFGEDCSVMRVIDMDWLNVTVNCKHYTTNVTVR